MNAADIEHTPGLDSLPPRRAAVLVALLRLYDEHGRVTVRDITELVGISTSTCHLHLRALRREGLITWEEGRHGTLRPAVAVRAV